MGAYRGAAVLWGLIWLYGTVLAAGGDPELSLPRLVVRLPADGPASLAVYDGEGRLVRTLWAGNQVKAGAHTVTWDGTDDAGKPVAAGRYQWRAATGGTIAARYVLTAGNGHQPPIPGDPGLVVGLQPRDVATDAAGNVYYLAAAHGRSLQKFTSGGKSLWVARGSPYGVGTAVAVGTDYVYVANADYLWRHDPQTGRIVPFSADRIGIELPKPDRPPQKQEYRYDQLENGYLRYIDGVLRDERVRGLAALAGRVFVPLFHENRIAVYDGRTGGQASTILGVPHPGGIAAGRGGTLLVITGDTVSRYSPAGQFLGHVVRSGLVKPYGLAVGADGRIYVTDLAAPNSIKVFAPDGGLLVQFGKEWPPDGQVRADKLCVPRGIAVAGDGSTYVAEDIINRMQKLTEGFRPAWSVHAIYAENCCEDAETGDLVYGLAGAWPGSLYEWQVDYAKRIWHFKRFWYLPHGHPTKEVRGFTVHGSRVRRLGGHRFYYVVHKTVRVYRLEGDRCIPVARIGSRIGVFDKDGLLGLPGQMVIWADRNGDGLATYDECQFKRNDQAPGFVARCHDTNVEADGTLYWGNGAFKLVEVEGGVPYYNWDEVRVTPLEKSPAQQISGVAADAGRNVYYTLIEQGDSFGIAGWAKRNKSVAIQKYSPDGKPLFSVGRKAFGFRQPGEYYMATCAEWLDGFLFISDEPGPVDVWTDDGLYLNTMLEDAYRGVSPLTSLMSATQGELWQLRVFRHPRTGKVYMLIQAHEGGEHVRCYEVTGLEGVQRARGTIEVTPRQAVAFKPRKIERKVPQRRAAYKMNIWRAKKPIAIKPGISQFPGGLTGDFVQTVDRSARAKLRAFYDSDYLYVAVEATGDTSPGVNANADAPGNMWAGDSLELFVSSDPKANRSRPRYTDTDFQFVVPVSMASDNRTVYCENRKGFVPESRFAVAVDPAGRSWTLCARIPWQYMGTYRPTPGDEIGWDFIVNLGSDDGSRASIRMTWCGTGRQWVSPNIWGQARITFVD